MSTWEVGFHRLALAEFHGALNRYRSQSALATTRFVAAVDIALQKIADDPAQWPEFRPGYRWVRVHKFPYVLYFQLQGMDRVRILAVAHTKRRPGYWIRRQGKP